MKIGSIFFARNENENLTLHSSSTQEMNTLPHIRNGAWPKMRVLKKKVSCTAVPPIYYRAKTTEVGVSIKTKGVWGGAGCGV